jgi:hypothetical protein
MDLPSDEEHQLFLLASDCNDAFKEAVQDTEKRDDVIHIQLRNLYDRFMFWTAYMGAYAPGSGSLDFRLRRHASYRSLIKMSLLMLRDNLDYCTFRHVY